MAGRRIRIKDVAEEARVSVSTVSLVLNDVPGARITDSTRIRVQEAARRLQYVPSSLARGLRMQRSGTLGLVGDRIATTPYAGQIIVGAHAAAAELDLTLLLVDTGKDRRNEAREIESLLRRQVDGILYASMYHREIVLPDSLAGIPTVVVDASTTDQSRSSVVPDEEDGAYAAASELLGAGHRRIGFLNNVDDIPATRLRLAGFQRAHHERGLEVDERLVAASVSETVPGYEIAVDMLRREAPTALFCFNDRMAMGAYRAAAELGLKVPADLSIVGFDDQRLISEGLFPQLTTMALPHHEMGAYAVRLLVHELDEPDSPRQRVSLRCPLVRRDSVAPPGLTDKT